MSGSHLGSRWTIDSRPGICDCVGRVLRRPSPPHEMRLTIRCLSPLVLAATVACGRSESTSHDQSAVVQVRDSVLLAQHDSAFVARAGGVSSASDGDLIIADRQTARVLRFSRTGALVRAYGRLGRGPAEFTSPGPAVVFEDSLLAVVDMATELRVLGLSDGKERWRRVLPSRPVFSMAAMGSRLIINAPDSARRTSLIVLDPRTGEARHGGPWPAPLGKYQLFDTWFSYSKFAVWGGDSVATVLEASDDLFWGTMASGGFRRQEIPRRTRRGARPELQRGLTEDPASIEPLWYQTSHPWAVQRLGTSGLVAVVHADQNTERGRLFGPLTISLIDRARRRACADVPLPVTRDPMPWVAFDGDTLWVVTQELDATGAPQAWRRAFTVDAERCEWSSSR